MQLVKIICYLFLLVFIVTPASFCKDDYVIVTGDLPPWSLAGKSGIMADIVHEIERRLKRNNKSTNLPWSRAQKNALASSNHIIYPLTRTTNRETKYTWIIKVMPSTLAFATIGGKGVGLEEAKKADSVLVHQDSPPFYFLDKHGFKNLQKIADGGKPILRMMEYGRSKIWFAETNIARYVSKGTKLEGKLVFGPPQSSYWMYIAGSKNISKEIVRDYQRVFKTIKADGTFDKIMNKYMPK